MGSKAREDDKPIICACGCGELITSKGAGRFKLGHKTWMPTGPPCACGCGEPTSRRDIAWRAGHKPWEDRYWARVDKGDGCWMWTGPRLQYGYGTVWVRGAAVPTHRAAWYLAYGEWPDAKEAVGHSCGNPPCVRPDHLFLGTPADNNDDRERKGRGRHPYGKGVGTAKLTTAEVQQIRERYLPRIPGRRSNSTEIAKEFGIHRMHVNAIVARRARYHE